MKLQSSLATLSALYHRNQLLYVLEEIIKNATLKI